MHLILARFISGQGIIQIANLSVGIIFLWLLPVEEYALYVIALFFLTVASIITNLGVSRAITTLGARQYEDRLYLGSLYLTGLGINRRTYLFASGIVAILSVVIFYDKNWPISSILISILLLLLICWYQNKVNLQQALLNIHHDDKGLFAAGILGGGSRLLMSGLCYFWPETTVALAGNLIGVYVSNKILDGRSSRYVDALSVVSHEIRQSITRFIIPLSPMIVYFAFQSQISIFILSIYGYTESIAQVGALGRLGQIITLLMMLNPFFIQPYFTRIENKKHFIGRLGLIVVMLLFSSVGLVLTSIIFPGAWLFVLGGNYSGLVHELPIAIAGALFTLIGGTLYTIVLSRNDTRFQYWGIIIGIGCQLAFITMNGVHTTIDALLLNLLPAVGYACVQAMIMGRIIYCWKDS